VTASAGERETQRTSVGKRCLRRSRLEIEGRKQLVWDETVLEILAAVLQMPEVQVGLHPQEEVVRRM